MLASHAVWWVLGSGLLLACNGQVVDSPDGGGGGAAGSVDGYLPGTSGSKATAAGATGARGGADPNGLAGASGETACPDCPAALGVQLCCTDFCGYLNTESRECEPALDGSRILPIVTAPQGELCRARWQCESSEGCPPQLPAEGSGCTENLHCFYCAIPAIPRAVRCLAGAWVTIGPNPPCSYRIDPVR